MTSRVSVRWTHAVQNAILCLRQPFCFTSNNVVDDCWTINLKQRILLRSCPKNLHPHWQFVQGSLPYQVLTTLPQTVSLGTTSPTLTVQPLLSLHPKVIFDPFLSLIPSLLCPQAQRLLQSTILFKRLNNLLQDPFAGSSTLRSCNRSCEEWQFGCSCHV